MLSLEHFHPSEGFIFQRGNGSLRSVVEETQPLMEMADVIDHLSHSWGNVGFFPLGLLTSCLLHMGKCKKNPPSHSGRRGLRSLHLVLESLEGCGTWEHGAQEGLESWDGLNFPPLDFPPFFRWMKFITTSHWAFTSTSCWSG